MAYPTAAYKFYQSELATFFSTLTPEEPIEVHDGPVDLTLRFVMPRPKTRSIIIRGWMKPDIDNVVKGIMDAMTKAAYFWLDDAQVVKLLTEKRFASSDDEVLGTHVQVRNL